MPIDDVELGLYVTQHQVSLEEWLWHASGLWHCSEMDPYTAIASWMYGIGYVDVSPHQRVKAKELYWEAWYEGAGSARLRRGSRGVISCIDGRPLL